MHNRIKLMFIIVFLMIISIGNYNRINAVEQERIKKFDIEMKVNKSGEINVTQKLDVYFPEDKHGIYAYIPREYTMDFGKKYGIKKYTFPITNISVKKFEYDVTDESGNTLIKIGSADSYVVGDVSYEYSYKIHTKDLGLDSKQMLYFNLVGASWTLPIDKVNFKINMPSDFNNDPIFYLLNDKSNLVKYEKKGNTIIGEYNNGLGVKDPLTVSIELDNNYFEFPTAIFQQTIIIGLLLITTIISFILFMLYGRDKKVISSIQFKAPDGLSSAQVGYIVDNSIDKKDKTSLLIYWASKGYLQIEEISGELFKITKIKDTDPDELDMEKYLFDSLFTNSDIITTDDVPEEYGKNLTMFDMDIYNYYKNKDVAIFEKKQTMFEYIFRVLGAVLIASFISISHYFTNYDWVVSLIIFGIILIVTLVVGFLFKYTMTNTVLRKTGGNIGRVIMLIIVNIIYLGVLMIMAYLFNINYLFILIVYACFVFGSIINSFIEKRTERGHRLLEQILGLKDFIEHAEKDQLEMFVHENPSYFYDILPYAYVLGISKKWIKQFENIKINQPSWYVSSTPMTDMLFLYSLNNSFNSIGNSLSTPPIEIDSNSGSGGFDFGGGGGSAGGGFGGGGGGSW